MKENSENASDPFDSKEVGDIQAKHIADALYLSKLNSDLPGSDPEDFESLFQPHLRSRNPQKTLQAFNLVGKKVKEATQAQLAGKTNSTTSAQFLRGWAKAQRLEDEEQPVRPPLNLFQKSQEAFSHFEGLRRLAEVTGNAKMFDPFLGEPSLFEPYIPSSEVPSKQITELVENPIGGVMLPPDQLVKFDKEPLKRYAELQR